MGWKDIEQKVLDSLNKDQRTWVGKNVNTDADNNLLLKSREWLIERFPEAGGEPGVDLNDAGCLRTLIWQSWLRIKVGELEPVDGNERSFWYRDVEPFYIEKGLMEPGKGKRVRSGELLSLFSAIDEEGISRILSEAGALLPAVSEELLEKLAIRDQVTFERFWRGAKEMYLNNLISRSLNDFVKAGMFRFQGEFKFRDPREEFRIIGRKKARIMFYTEKEGLWWLCEYAAEKHGITAVASKGEPGLLATEYLYDALVAAKVRSLDIGAISDYDPWGAKIPVNLLDKFQEKIFFGPKPGKVKLTAFNAKEKDLEKFFTPEEIERYKRDLRTYSQYKHSQVKEWVDGGGGIKREWYGIHIDTANRQRLRDEVDRWVMSVS